jgi:hypothetical protein
MTNRELRPTPLRIVRITHDQPIGDFLGVPDRGGTGLKGHDDYDRVD